MRDLNKLRLLAGIPIDASIEKTIREQDESLMQPTLEGAKRYYTNVKAAVDHVKAAVKILKGLPQIGNYTDNVRYANQLQEIISADGGQAGMVQMLVSAKKKLDKITKNDKLLKQLEKIEQARKKADEDEERLAQDVLKLGQEDQMSDDDFDPNSEEGDIEGNDLENGGFDDEGPEGDADDDFEPMDNDEYNMYSDEGPLGRESLGYMDAEQYEPSEGDFDSENENEEQQQQVLRKISDLKKAISRIEKRTIAKQKFKSAKEKITGLERMNIARHANQENEEDDNGPGYYGFTGTTRSGTKGGFSVKAKNRADAYKVAQEKHPGFIQLKCLGRDRDLDKVMAREGVYYDKTFPLSHEDSGMPGNVVSKKDKETVWANMPLKPTDKDESPNQLDALGDPSQSDHETKVRVPAEIKSALRNEIADIRKKIDTLGGNDRDSKQFYIDLSNAFEELLGYLEIGTVIGIKKAQIFMPTLMGPILHKIPAEVVNFIAQGGQQRSLKDYVNKVKLTNAD